MAYKPVKQFFLLLTTLFFSWQPACHGMIRMLTNIPAGYYGCMGANIALANDQTLYMAYTSTPGWQRCWRNLPGAHKDVRDFILSQLNPQDKQLADKLQIKHMCMPKFCTMLARDNMIFINTDDHEKLFHLLEKKQRLTDIEKDLLAYYTVVANHEIGHIKHKDTRKIRFMYPAVNLALYGVSWAAAKLCSIEHYYKPSQFADTQTNYELFKAGLFLIGTGIAQGLAHRKIINWWRKNHQEIPAQQYALDQARDPEILRGYARHVTRKRSLKAEDLIERVIKELKTIAPSKLYFKYYCHRIHRNFLQQYPEYKASAYSEDALKAFRQWLTLQHNIIDNLQAMFDREHPTYTQLIQEAQDAAALLESYQKKHAAGLYVKLKL